MAMLVYQRVDEVEWGGGSWKKQLHKLLFFSKQNSTCDECRTTSAPFSRQIRAVCLICCFFFFRDFLLSSSTGIVMSHCKDPYWMVGSQVAKISCNASSPRSYWGAQPLETRYRWKWWSRRWSRLGAGIHPYQFPPFFLEVSVFSIIAYES